MGTKSSSGTARKNHPGAALSAGHGMPGVPLRVTSTEAQNQFGRLMARVAQDGVVVVTRRHSPDAVMISSTRYEELVATEASVLNTLTSEFDALFARMQDPEVSARTSRGFHADAKTMGKAAHAVAHRRGA